MAPVNHPIHTNIGTFMSRPQQCPSFPKRLYRFLQDCRFGLYRKITLSALIVFFQCASFGIKALALESLSAQEIIHRAISKAESQHESQAEALFESESLSITQSLDSENRPTKTESARYRQYPIRGALFEELIEKNGIPLGKKDVRKEENRKQDFIREVDKRRSQGKHPQPEPDPGIRMNQEFVARYQLKLTGTEMVRDHLCWVIAFEPKPGDLPVRNRMDRALNQSTGRFWVSQEDDGIVRIDFALRKPFKYWGGILAVIRNTEGKIDYTRIEPNVWVPLHFDLKLDLEVMLVKDIRRVITKSWTHYQRAKTR